MAPGEKLRQHKLGAGAVSQKVFKIRDNMRKLERRGKRDGFFAVFSFPLAIGSCVIAKLEMKVRKYWSKIRGTQRRNCFLVPIKHFSGSITISFRQLQVCHWQNASVTLSLSQNKHYFMASRYFACHKLGVNGARKVKPRDKAIKKTDGFERGV